MLIPARFHCEKGEPSMAVIDVSKVDTTPGNDAVCPFPPEGVEGTLGGLQVELICGLGIVI